MRQFTIRGVLLYVALWAICLAPIQNSPIGRDGFAWDKDWCVLFTWCALGAFYIWKRRLAPLVAHSLGLVLIITPQFAAALFLGSFAGLAVFSVMVLVDLVRRDKSLPERPRTTEGKDLSPKR